MATAVIIMVVTATTMRADMAERRGAGRFLLALISACIGVATIAIAVPRIGAYAAIAPWSSGVPTGSQIETEPLADAVQSYARATVWLPSNGVLQQDYARLLMQQARTPDAIAALRASLMAAPNRTFSWSLLACLEDEVGADGAVLAPMLRLSYATGPREASSMLRRAAVPIHHWAEMPDDLKDAARAELRLLHEAPWMRSYFFRLYIEQDFTARILIRDAVLATPADAVRFNRAVGTAADLAAAAP